MSPKTEFLKCVLCVILYLMICFFLLKIKQGSYLTDSQDFVAFIKRNQTKQRCTFIPLKIPKPTNLEMKLLKLDEMEGKPIDLSESVSLLQQVSETCLKYNLQTALVPRHFLYNAQRKSLYCWIRKVASTSFTKLFMDMGNRPPTQNYQKEVDILAAKSMRDLQLALNDSKTFKFLVVRHPFQRLVSSFRDRIEDNLKYTAQAWIFVEKIFRLTRPNMFHSNSTTGNFRQKVFTPHKRLKVVPTFREFTEWLLQSSEEDDVHWNRYYKHCGVCDIHYNYILKLEDYTYGQINYIFTKLRVDKAKAYFPNLGQTKGGNTNFDITCKYFANLTGDIMMKLYERYKIDFEMYNYSLARYTNCVH